jgi:hypothetical protein
VDTIIELETDGIAGASKISKVATVDRGTAGTSIASVIIPSKGATYEIHVFFQTTDGSITQFVRQADEVTWRKQGALQL